MKNIKQKINKNSTLDATKGQASKQMGTPLLVEDSVTVLPETIQPSNDANIGQASGATQEPIVSDGGEIQAGAPNPTTRAEIEHLVDKVFGGHLKHINGAFYIYIKGRWVRLQHDRAQVLKPIALHYGESKSASEIKKIVGQLKISYAEVAFPEPEPNLVCLTNGTLNLLKRELLPHNPEHWLRNKLDIAWNPDAKCPGWIIFLNSVYRDDIDKSEKILLLKQWFGYCLVPSTLLHKFLVMIGAGSNGKSVILDILASIVGEENTSRAMVENLNKHEVLAGLDGMLLNISSEMTEKGWRHCSHIKTIVSGDKTQVRRLYGNPFTIKPTARLVMATNTYPKVIDDSEGFFRRMMILKFNRQFSDAEQNKHLTAELMQELEGIFVWAVEGLVQLIEANGFVVPASSSAAKNRYRIEADVVQLFLEACMEVDPDREGIRVPVLYEEFSKWARKSGFAAIDIKIFGRRLARAGIEKRRGNPDFWLVRRRTTDGDTSVMVQPVPAQPVEVQAAALQVEVEAG